MNGNGFYALDFAGVGHAEFPGRILNGSGFTIHMCYLTDYENDSGVLAAVDNLFSIELYDGMVCLKHANMCAESGEKVPFRCWNVFTITYDGTRLGIYCNSVLLVENRLTIALSGEENIQAGAGLRGSYLKRIAVYNRCLGKEEIDKTLLYGPNNAAWQAEFCGGPDDTEGYCKEWLHNCHVLDLVYTLDCRQGELYAKELQLPKEGFSVLCTCNLLQRKFSEGDQTVLLKFSDIAIELRDGDENNSFYLTLCYGGHSVDSYLWRAGASWIDLTLVFGEEYIKVYLNENCQIEYCKGFSERTVDIKFGEFAGYIDYCAIIDHALTEHEICRYRNEPPYLFDNGVQYLFRFSDNVMTECCEGLMLTENGAKHILVKETGACVRSGKQKPVRLTEKREYSRFARWQVEVLLRLLVEWLAAWLGAYPDKGVSLENGQFIIKDAGLYPFVYQEIASLSEAQELLADYENVTKDGMLNLIRRMKQTGALKKLVDYLYQKDQHPGMVSDILLAMLAAAVAAGLFLKSLMSAIGGAIVAAGVILPPPQPSGTEHDSDDKDKEKKKKKTYLAIRQMSVKSRLQVDYGKEKDAFKDENKVVGLFAKKGTDQAKLKTEISCKGREGKFEITAVSIGGKIIEKTVRNVTCVPGENIIIEMDIRLDKTEISYGKWEERLRWTSKSDDGEQKLFLGETSCEIYLLEEWPGSPWGNSIHVNCLELCAACAKSAGNKSEGFAQDYARWLVQEEKSISSIAGIGEPADGKVKKKSYSMLPSHNPKRKAVFDAVNFAGDFCEHRGEIIFSAEDLIYSHALFCRLQGRTMNTVMLATGVECDIQYENGSWGSIPGNFLLQDTSVQIPGGSHYVSMDENGKVYDFQLHSYGLYFSDDLSRIRAGKQNSNYYRERYYVYGSYCEIITSIKTWGLMNVAAEEKKKINGEISRSGLAKVDIRSVQRGRDGNYFISARNQFTREVYNDVHPEEGESICHSISSRNIDEVLVQLLNNFRQNNLEIRINNLISALDPVNQSLDETEGIRNVARLLCEQIMRLQNGEINHTLAHLCQMLYNARRNLRAGNSRWNSSIGECFDPEEWFHYQNQMVDGSERQMYCESSTWDVYCANRRYYNLPEPIGEGFYLPVSADGIRISKLKETEVRIPIHVVKKYRYDNRNTEMQTKYSVLYSSSNNFPLHETCEEKNDLIPNDENVYYLVTINEMQNWVSLD